MKADGNIQIAEDATSTTFMKAFENINKFVADREGSSFSAWIYNIAYHSLLDILKRKESDSIDDEINISEDIDYVD